jgi:hypothetical protein
LELDVSDDVSLDVSLDVLSIDVSLDVSLDVSIDVSLDVFREPSSARPRLLDSDRPGGLAAHKESSTQS